MDVKRRERIKELFEAALERPEEERSSFLAAACQNDVGLRLEIESLLSGETNTEDFLQAPVVRLPLNRPEAAPPPNAFSPQQIISGRFRVLRFIGQGGMGEVYEARDLELRVHVAVKTIRPEIASNPVTLARFKQEIELARRVAHPNVCRMYDLERHRTPQGSAEGEIVFLTMELLDGQTLADRLQRQGRMSSEEALPLIRQMADGLAAAHKVGVVHCDFKPGNVMLVRERPGDFDSQRLTQSLGTPQIAPQASLPSADLRAVIMDFGLARAMRPTVTAETIQASQATSDGDRKLLGTRLYMAPEQWEGGAATPATDVYALGLVAHEMLAGRRPLSGPSQPGAIDKRLKEPPPPLRDLASGVDPRLESVILRCLETNPSSRFQNAMEVLEGLDGTRPPVQRRSERWTAVLIAVAALLVTLIALTAPNLRNWLRGRNHPTQIRSLAVLPLENLSGKADQDYFADGMTDELITDLAKISALRVISRTSVMSYKGTHRPISEVARTLGVDAVLEGTVLRSGYEVRITARLIDARTGGTIWSESYERDLRDVLALQSAVATSIADGIRIRVTPQEQARLAMRPSVNTEAYEAYLKGRYEWNKATEHDRQQARQYFEQAVRIDRNYAPAYAGLADYFWSTDEMPPKEAMPKAKQYALKALEIDPNLAEAHTSLGVVEFYGDWNWAGAERDFRRALELDPGDAEAHRVYSDYLSGMGRADEALEESRNAEKLDPVSIDAVVATGWVYYYARRYDQSLAQCREAIDLEPSFPSAHDCVALSYLATKGYEKAIAESQKAVGLSNELNIAVGLARAYALGGDTAEARKILDEWRERAERAYVAPSLLAEIYIVLGEKGEGFAWLEKAYADRDGYLTRLKVEPGFDAIRSDQRFQNLMRRLNLSP